MNGKLRWQATSSSEMLNHTDVPDPDMVLSTLNKTNFTFSTAHGAPHLLSCCTKYLSDLFKAALHLKPDLIII